MSNEKTGYSPFIPSLIELWSIEAHEMIYERAQQAEAELVEAKKTMREMEVDYLELKAERDRYKKDAKEFDRQATAFYERLGELRQVLETIAHNHDGGQDMSDEPLSPTCDKCKLYYVNVKSLALDECKAERDRLRKALKTIASYGNDGICPYGCDTPNIAREALEGQAMSLPHNHSCPTCRKVFTCADRDCSDDDLCYECLQAELENERDRLRVIIETAMYAHWDLKCCDCPLCVQGRAAGCRPDPHREEGKP